MDLFDIGDDRFWYTPDFKNNRQLPEGERLQVELSALRAGELRQLESMPLTKSKGKDAHAAIAKRGHKMQSKTLRAHVHAVKGAFKKDKDGNKEPLLDVEVFLSFCEDGPAYLSDLLTDIANAIYDAGEVEDELGEV